MDIAITKMSAKGQIVIPVEMRKGIHEGDKLIIMKSDHQFIMKKASEMDEKMKEDLEFARRTEEAWKEIEGGKCETMTAKELLKELER